MEDDKMKTLKNKIAAIALLLVGLLPIIPSVMLGEKDIDCTYMVLLGIISICLFFSKESCFGSDSAVTDDTECWDDEDQ